MDKSSEWQQRCKGQEREFKTTLLQTENKQMLQMKNVCMLVTSVVSDSLKPNGTVAAKLLCPWGSPGKNTGVGCCALLQGIFQIQGSNPHFLHLLRCSWSLYRWAIGEALVWAKQSIISCTSAVQPNIILTFFSSRIVLLALGEFIITWNPRIDIQLVCFVTENLQFDSERKPIFPAWCFGLSSS